MLRVENLSKSYTVGGRAVVGGITDVSFEVNSGEFYTLLGPSGCGKTTTLRAVAGLEEPNAGRISIGGRTVFDSDSGVAVAANERGIGMVFQSYAVWPHMTVFDNVAFPLKMSRTRRYATSEIDAKVRRTLETMGLGTYAERSAALLSGGQQQRLSLARALVAEPRLLLLDEPLSNLDALLREQMRSELRRLHKDVGVAAVYVTHDQSEALALSDRIAIMRNGAIAQIGSPKQIYHAPESEFVATFVGRCNVLRGRLHSAVAAGQTASVDTALGPIECRFLKDAPARAAIVVLIRPEHVVLAAPHPAEQDRPSNRFGGKLVNVTFLGQTTEYLIQLADQVQINVRTSSSDPPASMDSLVVTFPADRTLALPDSTR